MKADLKRRTDPRQSRGERTIKQILTATGELLEEVGFERLSTNLVCKKAGLTPPALYRYFPNKYAILSELSQQLMDEQNVILRPHFERILREDDPTDAVYLSMKEQLELTERAPGGRWILRALHATPALCDIRTSSHDMVAEELADAILEQYPNMDRHAVRQTMRLNIEIGYSIIEYILDVPGVDRESLLRETATMIAQSLRRHTE